MEKRYIVIVTNQAQEQLEATKQYYVYKLHAKDAAHETFADLEVYPKRGRLTEEEPWRSQGIRIRPIKTHNVYYWIDEVEMTVWVTAVIATRMDQQEQLKKIKMK